MYVELTGSQDSQDLECDLSPLGKLHPIHYPNTTEKKNKQTMTQNDTPGSPKCSPIILDDQISVFELDL